MSKRSPTTKDISLLYQLYQQGQLFLAPEYQRENVWPNQAKAYLIDTILNDRPIPLLFFQRVASAQTGRPAYSVIDGQQRLRAIFEFFEDRFRLTQSDKNAPYYKKRFSDLPRALQDQIYNYDLTVEELSDYSDSEIRDMFARMNRYVVKLSKQELRHAKQTGKFSDFVDRVGKWDFWRTEQVFSRTQLKRMRQIEFSAELTILLAEGPQDKKSSVDLYYGQYKMTFPQERAVEKSLKDYLSWIKKALPNLRKTRFRKPVDLYSLIGALDRLKGDRPSLAHLEPKSAGERLSKFEGDAASKEKVPASVAKYLTAASRQTDNILPRNTRIAILCDVILGS